jgi:hypothetical protein
MAVSPRNAPDEGLGSFCFSVDKLDRPFLARLAKNNRTATDGLAVTSVSETGQAPENQF